MLYSTLLVPASKLTPRKVTISYILQSLLLLAAYFAQSASRFWITLIAFPVFLVRALGTTGLSKAYGRAEELQARCRFPRQMASLVAALVEFQKTQVFFVATIEVAVIITLYNGVYMGASSWAELWINIVFMHKIGTSGVDPVVLGMCLLRKAGKLSWYVSVASVVCVLVSSVTVFKSFAGSGSPGQVEDKVAGLDACWEEAPRQYCLLPQYPLGYGITSRAVVYFAISPAIMSVMLLEKSRHVRAGLRTAANYFALDTVYQWMCRRIGSRNSRRLVRLGKRVPCFFAEIWLVVHVCLSVQSYIIWLPFIISSTPESIWPLGQIIAVAVWIPVIVQLVYLLLRRSIRRGARQARIAFAAFADEPSRWDRERFNVPTGAPLSGHQSRSEQPGYC